MPIYSLSQLVSSSYPRGFVTFFGITTLLEGKCVFFQKCAFWKWFCGAILMTQIWLYFIHLGIDLEPSVQ